MLRFYEGWGLLVLALDVYCVISIIVSREDEVRNLPKIVWLLLVLLFPMIGSIAWLVAGAPSTNHAPRPHQRSASQYPEYDRPGRAAGVTAESDEEFLRRVRERAEEQRRTYAEQQKARREQEEGGGGANP